MRLDPLNKQELSVGIDIGGTKLATVVATIDGVILHKIRQPTEAEKGSDYVVSKQTLINI